MSPSEYEQLVEFLGRQFTEIDRRFEQIDRRFDLVAGRFDRVDRRFDQVDGQIAELRREMLGHFDETYRGGSSGSSRSTTPSCRGCAGSRRVWLTRAGAARSSPATWPS